MQLYLMQHGQSLNEEEHPEQPLSRAGIATVQESAAALKRLGLNFSAIVCSPKRRAHQTAALIAEAVRYPYSDIGESNALKPTAPPGEVLAFLRDLPENDSVLVVGHLPSLAHLAALLLGGEQQPRLRFAPGGLTLLDCSEPQAGGAELVFHLPPEHLRLLGREGS